jgi:hypothetical protein
MFHRFIASQISLNWVNAFAKKKHINAKKRWSYDLYWHFQEILLHLRYFRSKAEILSSLLFHILYADFGLNSYSVDSDEAMTPDDEVWNASSLQYFRIVKRFITTIFTQRLTLHRHYFFKENHRLTPYHHYYFTENHQLTLPCRYFLK